MRKLVTLLSSIFALVVLVAMSESNAFASNPPKEICNGQDDDGDGLVDEDWPIGEECWGGRGLCRGMGYWTCGDLEMAVCVPVHYVAPKPEECNGLDDNCDGLVDNFNTITCHVESDINPCGEGRIICTPTQDHICVPIPPTAEVCGNDLDEDCNGVAEVCIGDEPKNDVDAGVAGLDIDTVNTPSLGTPCRPVYMKSEASCSYSPPSPHPLLPISAVLVVIGAVTMISRRRRLL